MMSRSRPPDPEYQALDHARRVIAVRIATVTTVVMLFVGIAVYGVVITAQNTAADRELRWVAAYGDPGSPPGCTWLAVRRDDRVRTSPGMPDRFPLRAPMRQVSAGDPPIRQQLRHDGVRYQVLTTTRDDTVVQAVYDARLQDRERNLLLVWLGAAEGVAVLGAMLAGGLLARRAMTPLAEALRRQRRFVADASHELRSPVTRLHTRAQLLARRSAGCHPERAQHDLTKLVDDTRQLGDIIDDLLLASRVRVDIGGPGAKVDVVDLAELADAAVEADASRAQQAGITVTVLRGTRPHTVAGVRTSLCRVVGALLDNALGHTGPGGQVTITVASGSAGTVLLSVRDDGEGIDPGDADRLFERFARGAGGAGRRFGIGLSLVREVVQSHRGTVTAEGAPGEGALFTVVLPAAPGHHVRQHTDARPTRSDPPSGAPTTDQRDGPMIRGGRRRSQHRFPRVRWR